MLETGDDRGQRIRRWRRRLREDALEDLHEQVEDRVKGMAVQRQESRSLNVSVSSRSKASQSIDTVNDIDARIKQLEAEVNLEDPPEIGAGDRAALQVEAPKEEREVITVGVFRRQDPALG